MKLLDEMVELNRILFVPLAVLVLPDVPNTFGSNLMYVTRKRR